MRALLTFLLLIELAISSVAQQRTIQQSENGWYLSPHGSIRVLVLFAEIEYDVNPGKDPQPAGAKHWPKGSLPQWKDDLFDPNILLVPKARISRYYHDVSLGRYAMLGDYVDRVLTLRESEYPSLGNAHGINAHVVKEANKAGSLRTHHGLEVKDFDQWKRGGKPGLPKAMGADDPHSYDHVMVILRNSTLTHGQGSVDHGSPGKLFGYESDSQSRFGGMNALPFEILQHEFNHMFFGSNNFHSGGGNAAMFTRYFLSMQGGWGMMGGANSSLLTCNAWDRDRLGWKPEGAVNRIRARGPKGQEVNSDLDPLHGDTGIYVLRDFMASGDALRIRLPFIPEAEYAQWIWLENHQTFSRNGVPSDRFHYEEGNDCVKGAVPGIHAYIQVDREDREGPNIFGGHADHLRPLVASGHYDYGVRDEEQSFNCISQGSFRPMVRDEALANPLTGNHDLEFPAYDLDKDGRIDQREQVMLRLEERKGILHDEAYTFGHSRQIFTLDGVRRIGMDSNPSLSSQLTLVRGAREMNQRKAPDNRVVHLNGISVELMEQRANGDIVLKVRSDDTRVRQHMRWCADSIALHAVKGHQGHALYLDPGICLSLDRGLSPTRMSEPDTVKGKIYFNDPTRLSVDPGASMFIASGATLQLMNGSELHLMPGSLMIVDPKAQLRIDPSSKLVVHGNATLKGASKAMSKLRKKGRIVDRP